MSSEFSLTIKDNTGAIAALIAKNGSERLFTFGQKLAAKGTENCVRRTGALAESIYAVTTDHSDYAGAAGTAKALNPSGQILPAMVPAVGECLIGPAEEYGADVELGGLHNPAEPYLVPAAEQMRGEAESHFAGLLET